MNKELFFISKFNNEFIGDDGAVIDGMVYSCDAFCENVHFKREWMDYEMVASKAMLVNISDAIAMNAKPLYALVSIAMPKSIAPLEMEALAHGLNKTAKEYGCQIIGGDTVASDRLDLCITIVSKTKKPIFRRPLREGYYLAYTGNLGNVSKDLRRLMRGGRVSKQSKFFRPNLRQKFMNRASRKIKTAMDISDGLFDDLAKMANLNKKGVEFFKSVPKRVGCSGEEYEILFSFDPKDKEAIKARAKSSRTPITIFGKVVRGKFRNLCKPNHF